MLDAAVFRPALLSTFAGGGHWVYVYYDYADCATCHLDHFGDRRLLRWATDIEYHEPATLPAFIDHIVFELSRAGELTPLNLEFHQMDGGAQHYGEIHKANPRGYLAKYFSLPI